MRKLAIFPTKRFQPRRYRPGNLGTWTGHLPFAHDLMAAMRPSVFVELGTHYGESYFGFCQAVEENAINCKCYAVDTWRGDDHASFYDEDVFEEVNAYNESNYAAYSSLLRETFDEASEQFGPHSIDLLHIDGLHTYEAVKHDFETWLPKVRPGGVVLLHDIHARHATFRVWQLWEELKAAYPHFEFPHYWGLGLVRIGEGIEEEPELLKLLLDCNEEDCQAIREQYLRAGEYLELSHRHGFTRAVARGKPLAQVFAGRHGGFAEEESVTAELQPGIWHRYQFALEQGCQADELRIDFADLPCVVELAAISIRRAANESVVLYQMTEASRLTALECVNGLLPFGDGREAKFLCYGYDPQIHLALPDIPGLKQPLTVELWMRVNLDLVEVAGLLRERAAAPEPVADAPGSPVPETPASVKELTAALEAAHGERDRIAAERDEAVKERGAALRRAETLVSEVRLHQTERLVLTSEFRRLAGIRRSFEAENEGMRERVRRDQNLRLTLEKEAVEFRKRIEQLQWTVAQQVSELDQLRPGSLDAKLLQGEVERLRGALRDEIARREDLERSYSWRITGPVRGAMKLLRLPGAPGSASGKSQ